MQDNSKNATKNRYAPNLLYFSGERTQKFLSIVLTLIALSLFGFFAVNPTIATIVRLQKEVSDSKFVYNELESKIRNLSELRKQYSLLQNDLSIVTDAIPTEPDVHLLFAQIQAAGRESNVKIIKLQNFEVEVLKNNKSTEKQYYSFFFSIVGNGTFQNISNFAKTIANMQRVIDIDAFSITNREDQSLGFNIRGAAFFKN